MKRRRRKLALVPSAVFGTVFAGVVPAVVASSAGCGGDDSQKPDAQYYGVGAPCCSVAAIFEAGPDRRDGTVTDAPEDTSVDHVTDAPEAG
jgi:hypothetical protein